MPGLKKQVVLKNYKNNFLHQMNEMRKQNILCDVRFVVKDKEFSCHKIVLLNPALDSEYFKTMFNSNFKERESETILLQDIEPKAMDEIITAIYTEQFDLHRSNAYHILRASHRLLLMEIFNEVESCIMQNTEIDFLIETCLFAETAEREDLFSKCIAAIAADLNDLSKTDSFNEKITFELLKMILEDKNVIGDKEALFQMIMRWSNHNKSSEDEVLQLLNAANLRKSDCMNAPAMANLIVNSYNATSNGISTQTDQNRDTKSIFVFGEDQNVCYNVYLNTVDVKSGAKGWATLQSKLESNECSYKFINHQLYNPTYRKIKKVGTRLYSFDYDKESKRNTFSYYNKGKQFFLPTPSGLVHNQYYDIEAVDNFIYYITGEGKLSKYDCKTNLWIDLSIYHPNTSYTNNYSSNTLYTNTYQSNTSFSSPKLTSNNGKLFVIGVRGKEPFTVIPNQSLTAQYLKKCPRKFTNPAVCCYNDKLVVCGSDHDNNLHNIVSMYDTVAQNWYNLKDMNIGRADHQLNYHNGFLYAIENKLMAPNEKYDIKLNKWTCIPSLPQRLNFTPGNCTLATGSVFGCTIE